ncbi:MAG: hypothetical protein ABIR98_09980 [Usitatibacter sp.]
MKSIKILVAVAVAAGAMLAAADVQAQAKHGWSGHRGGHWGGWYGPRVGFYIGAPLLYGSYYWGRPWYDSYYDGPRVVYREVIREPEYIEVDREPVSATPSGAAGAPTQGPAYMNYCASAKAYYPKVASCPEGWKFLTPTQ